MAQRAVIFDMDGVLVLSLPAHWVAWQQTAQAHGVTLTRAEFLGFNGLTNTDICQRLFGARATPAFITEIGRSKEHAYREAIAHEVPLAPGCAALLAALHRAGLPIAVGTSGPAENVDLVLDRGGIRPFFGAVVHAGLVQRGKPAPDIFLRAAELLRVPPRDCIVIEDAPAGVQAAHAAGMRVIALQTNHTADELCAERPHALCAALQDVTLDLVQAL